MAANVLRDIATNRVVRTVGLAVAGTAAVSLLGVLFVRDQVHRHRRFLAAEALPAARTGRPSTCARDATTSDMLRLLGGDRMIIHCDNCGIVVQKQDALIFRVDEETYYFCSAKCMQAAGHLDPSQEPDPDDRTAGPLAGGNLDEPEN